MIEQIYDEICLLFIFYYQEFYIFTYQFNSIIHYLFKKCFCFPKIDAFIFKENYVEPENGPF